ncbi:hypothetical protein GRF29_28g2918053, partial [Pseudopithomyces chartarum]
VSVTMTIDPTYSLFTPTLIVVSVVFPTLASITVALRLYVKTFKKVPFHWDDWTIIMSLALCWGLSIILWVMAPQIGITRVRTRPDEASLATFKFFWINEILFSIVLGLVKISVLLFYRRVFPVPNFKLATSVMISVIAGWTIAILVVSIFKTDPVSGIWTNPKATYRIDDAAYSISVAAMSLGFDIIILAMPIFVIRSLHLPKARKFAVIAIFWLGAFCVVCAAARLHLLNESIHSVTDNPNAYANLTIAFVFAEMEPNASVMAASLPMLRPLFAGDEKGPGSWWRSKFSSASRNDGASSTGNSGGTSVLFKHPGGDSTG